MFQKKETSRVNVLRMRMYLICLRDTKKACVAITERVSEEECRGRGSQSKYVRRCRALWDIVRTLDFTLNERRNHWTVLSKGVTQSILKGSFDCCLINTRGKSTVDRSVRRLLK